MSIIYIFWRKVKNYFFFSNLCTYQGNFSTSKVHFFDRITTQDTPYRYTTLPSEVYNLPLYGTHNDLRNLSTTGFFALSNINKLNLNMLLPFSIYR